jgi:hypothetical protein
MPPIAGATALRVQARSEPVNWWAILRWSYPRPLANTAVSAFLAEKG